MVPAASQAGLSRPALHKVTMDSTMQLALMPVCSLLGMYRTSGYPQTLFFSSITPSSPAHQPYLATPVSSFPSDSTHVQNLNDAQLPPSGSILHTIFCMHTPHVGFPYLGQILHLQLCLCRSRCFSVLQASGAAAVKSQEHQPGTCGLVWLWWEEEMLTHTDLRFVVLL